MYERMVSTDIMQVAKIIAELVKRPFLHKTTTEENICTIIVRERK